MLKNTVENYKIAKKLFQEIDEIFFELQDRKENISGKLEDSEFVLNQVLVKVNALKKTLKHINADDLNNNYSSNTIEAIKSNLETFTEAVYYWERFFLGAKYASALRDPMLHKYVPELKLSQEEANRWGGETGTAKKLVSILTHPDQVLEYEKAIKRMILGTMTQNEFNRIFDLLKHKMMKKIVREEHEIATFEEFLNEDFFNPFDEDDEKEKKPKHISDHSGPLALRKETFNLARVEYSKRPGGEYTVIAKTQFASGEIVEMCPTILLKEEAKTIDRLKDIIFEIDRDRNEWALVLGYGSLYRHNEKANLDYAYNKLTKQMYFITKRPIKHGEELSINYGQDYWMERMNFNTMTDEKRTDNNQGMPITGRVVTKGLEESEVQPNAADIQDKTNMKDLSSPKNPANPVISGVAIIGGGQS